MGIIKDCIDTEIPEVVDFKKQRDDYLESKQEPVDPLSEPHPDTQQIIAVGSTGLDLIEDSRRHLVKVEAFIRRWYPEQRDMLRAMRKAIECSHKTEAHFKEALEGCRLTETDFIE